MVNKNIQMKKKNGQSWDNLFPITLTENVYTNEGLNIENHLENVNGEINDKFVLQDQLMNQLSSRVEQIENKKPLFFNVKDFGAIGDGVADDSQAIQNALDFLRDKDYYQTLVFPDGVYNIKNIVIKDRLSTTLLLGTAQTILNISSNVGFLIQSEGIKFKGFKINYTGDNTNNRGDVLFKDDRQYNRLDFDILVEDCDIKGWLVVVKTWGRGVEVFNNLFTDIVNYLVEVNVKPKNEIEEGNAQHQKYHSGYRGYFINNNRFHFCNNLWIMNTPNPASKVLNGVEIKDNIIEGTIRYFKGYVRDFICVNNNHYLYDQPRTALFDFAGGDTILIDVKIGGKQLSYHGEIGQIKELIISREKITNLNVRGVISGIAGEAIVLHDSGETILIDLTLNGLSSASRSIVELKAGTFDGLVVRGVVRSSNEHLIGIRNVNASRIAHYNFDGLVIHNTHAQKTNITI